MHQIFPIYFLAVLDKHGIQVIEGFAHDSDDRGWACGS
jgi:hypothetical protein